jgi:hypothetical protein
VVQKIACIQRQLFGNTKFDLMSRYQLGNLHYLVTPPGLLAENEAPLGWGLLEIAGDDLMIERRVPTRFSGAEMPRWLERIAQASTLQNTKPIREKQIRGLAAREVGESGSGCGNT